jgi:hypothetical protein
LFPTTRSVTSSLHTSDHIEFLAIEQAQKTQLLKTQKT